MPLVPADMAAVCLSRQEFSSQPSSRQVPPRILLLQASLDLVMQVNPIYLREIKWSRKAATVVQVEQSVRCACLCVWIIAFELNNLCRHATTAWHFLVQFRRQKIIGQRLQSQEINVVKVIGETPNGGREGVSSIYFCLVSIQHLNALFLYECHFNTRKAYAAVSAHQRVSDNKAMMYRILGPWNPLHDGLV